MNILQLDLKDKQQVDDFLRLPFSIYRDIPQWVPPLQSDERLRLSPKRSPFYKHSRASFFLAQARDVPDRPPRRPQQSRYNEFNKTKTAFFYLFECENHMEAATGLFNAAFEWARSRGLDKIAGW